MTSFRSLSIFLLGCCLAQLLKVGGTDVLVQLNVNRPLNDVNERFVSFAIKPEELYRALDGDNRKIITRMAVLLGDSYVKFTTDYDFATNSELKLRNPTNIIWKGFNRWAKAVNWTMIIPLPYDPDTWDAMDTLRILNSSYFNGITECVWQLGTDFGASHAEDYVADLSTLHLMIDTFKPYVDDWTTMGADISAGSSADETRRYIEMSKDLNTAFGWTQSTQSSAASPGSVIADHDPALRTLLREKVPVWITLPSKSKLKTVQANGNSMGSDDVSEGLHWAKTLGEAASTGFDAIFKRITAADLERPSFSYYVSALHKKVMGSRVFPARPLNIFSKTNKLYTHCANSVSGGIAFMVVNPNEQPLQVQVHSLTKMTASDVWQYTLTMKKGAVLLNNERLWFNSTLKPQKSVKQPNKAIQLNTPGRSVSFWVLPKANLEHCQYTEVVADEVGEDSAESQMHTKRYSSSDKLLRKLIQQSSLTNSALARVINRRRRYATAANRSKRFILKDKGSQSQGWAKLFKPFEALQAADVEEHSTRAVVKRENLKNSKSERRSDPLHWLTDLMEQTMTGELPMLKRGTRSADDDYFGPLFATKDGKTTKGFTKKITEIKKPERKIKPLFDMDEFDEEEFFKKMDSYREPEPPRLPEGDVHLERIANPDGEEIDEDADEGPKATTKSRSKAVKDEFKEVVNEMKPLRLLPTELYETLPLNPFKPAANGFGTGLSTALNSILFPEPFSKKSSKTKKVISGEKDIKPAAKGSSSYGSPLAKDFIRLQKELGKTFAEDNHQESKEHSKSDSKESEDLSEVTTLKPSTESTTENRKLFETESLKKIKEPLQMHHDYIPDNIENYFGENEDESHESDLKSKRLADNTGNQKFDEVSWWDMTPLLNKRSRRALYFDLPDEVVLSNTIGKDDDLIPLGPKLQPEQLARYQYRVETTPSTQIESTEKKSRGNNIVSTLKQKVTSLMDIFARHVSEWYNTFTKHIDGISDANKDNIESTTESIASNNVSKK